MNAFKLLSKANLIYKKGNAYVVGTLPVINTPGGRREVFLFNDGATIGKTVFRDPSLWHVYSSLSSELSRNGYIIREEPMHLFQSWVTRWCKGVALPYGIVVHKVSSQADVRRVLMLFDRLKAQFPQHRIPLIIKSSRNIPNVKVTDVNHFSAYDLIKYNKIVFTETSVKELEKRYS